MTVDVTTDGAPVTFSKSITVVTAATDKLFSSDAELVPHEPDIMRWIRQGRSSFLDIHRLAQDRILAILDEKGLTDWDGERLDKSHIHDVAEFNDWSKFMTLRFIFDGLSNADDDVFSKKAKKYADLANIAENRAILRLDRDADGTKDSNFEMRSGFMVRR